MSGSEPITVLLADDHALLRDMLRITLTAEGMQVVADVGSGEAAEAMCQSMRPDVAVLDIDIPGKCIFEVTRALQQTSPETRVIFLSAFVHDQYIADALAVEASGYLTKTEPPEVLVTSIRKAVGGATSFSSEVINRMVIGESGARLSGQHARMELLTKREREVLRYVAQGLQQKQIAARAGISIKTVQHHIMHLMDKLAIHDRVELARFAIREGLVEP
jgi:DNA-binding NarL/FixJ family response regulator